MGIEKSQCAQGGGTVELHENVSEGRHRGYLQTLSRHSELPKASSTFDLSELVSDAILETFSISQEVEIWLIKSVAVDSSVVALKNVSAVFPLTPSFVF